MYRILVKEHGASYAIKINSVEDDSENIEEMIASSDAVLLVDDLEDIEWMGLDIEVIEMEQ